MLACKGIFAPPTTVHTPRFSAEGAPKARGAGFILRYEYPLFLLRIRLSFFHPVISFLTVLISTMLKVISKVSVGKTIGDFFGEVKPPEEVKPDEILEVEPEPFDYSGGIEPEIIEENPSPAEWEDDIFEETSVESEDTSDDDEISYEEYLEFKRWKKMMKKKDMEM